MQITTIAVLLMSFVLLSNCSVYMAAKQPDAKNIELFRVGTHRETLLAEFGLPTISETRDGHRYEIYKFVNGYSASARTGRAVLHGAADVVTLGLWEVVGTPTEGFFSGDQMAYRVRYDKSDVVDEVAVLKQ
ncbi:MAG: hypothetical protein AB7F41_04415 [Methylocystis sp.]|uniref:hypothetical protein n=1 Tax=Methylocystis sp. TaxID=1911079 RepID=UPI003D0B6C19